MLPDDPHIVTAARCIAKSSEDVVAESSGSKLRRANVTTLSDEDDRYQGSVVERKDYEGDIVEEQSDESDDFYDRQLEDEDDDEAEMARSSEHGEEDSSAGRLEVENESGDTESTSEDDQIEQENSVRVIGAEDFEAEAKKCSAVQTQLKLWNKLLATRIRFQRVMPLVNSLPQCHDTWSKVSTPETDAKLALCRERLQRIFSQLLKLQDTLFEGNSVTANLSGVGCSGGDKEASAKKHEGSVKRRRYSLDDCSEILRSRREAFKKVQLHIRRLPERSGKPIPERSELTNIFFTLKVEENWLSYRF
ncbi:unnamed protein product [Soboliphyme baturini]|uniref:AATF-Che1 domain-containing protein n=1 Tax=Soboliphyme baturini TaxID=241478 RepID=A0A183IXC8_9BILA|nr:unnamed protein product [Soboliphyme baturini]